jgi:hypothetical protein
MYWLLLLASNAERGEIPEYQRLPIYYEPNELQQQSRPTMIEGVERSRAGCCMLLLLC